MHGVRRESPPSSIHLKDGAAARNAGSCQDVVIKCSKRIFEKNLAGRKQGGSGVQAVIEKQAEQGRACSRGLLLTATPRFLNTPFRLPLNASASQLGRGTPSAE